MRPQSIAHHIIHACTASASRGMRYFVCRKAVFSSLLRARRAEGRSEVRAARGFMRMTALSGTSFILVLCSRGFRSGLVSWREF